MILFLIERSEGQFFGGSQDGFSGSAFFLVALNEQDDYCSGGANDGLTVHHGVAGPLNSQLDYCSGSSGDGFDSEAHVHAIPDCQYHCFGGFADGTDRKHYISSLNSQGSYCHGSYGDGFDSEFISQTLNDLQFYCMGGARDGVDRERKISSLNIQGFYCLGTENDGFDSEQKILCINKNTFYCRSGSGDGSDRQEGVSPMNEQEYYCAGGVMDGYTIGIFQGYTFGYPLHTFGGTADGFCRSTYLGEMYLPVFALGGFADGHCYSIYLGLLDYPDFYRGGRGDGSEKGGDLAFLGRGIWMGKKNTQWLNTSNWKHDLLPDLKTSVLIPPGCIYYPVLSKSLSINTSEGMLQCRQLDILPGGSFTSTSIITINGIVNVSGFLISHTTSPDGLKVEPEGNLRILEHGTVIVE